MLGLRATFFIIDVLVKLFSLLKYGVSTVLVFIGVKLIISKVYHIPPMVVCSILFGTLAFSMVASVLLDMYQKRQAKKEDGVMGSAHPGPTILN
jgi:predicted tellurium resistance membrane protein TerC